MGAGSAGEEQRASDLVDAAVVRGAGSIAMAGPVDRPLRPPRERRTLRIGRAGFGDGADLHTWRLRTGPGGEMRKLFFGQSLGGARDGR